jgi:hypothetical protein
VLPENFRKLEKIIFTFAIVLIINNEKIIAVERIGVIKLLDKI